VAGPRRPAKHTPHELNRFLVFSICVLR
jgi:hypothetical protein